MHTKKVYFFGLVLVILTIIVAFFVYKNNTPPKQVAITPQKVSPSPFPTVNPPTPTLDPKYSSIQKYGIDNGLIPTGQTSDSPVDYEALNQIESKLKTDGTTFLDAMVLTLWFANFPTEKYDLATRQGMAKTYMESLHSRIKSGNITISQAADELKSDKSLEDIDRAWVNNAFTEITFAKKEKPSFQDPKLESLLWSLPVGEVSEVTLGGQPDLATGGWTDAYFTIMQVSRKETKEFDSIDEAIQQ